MPAEDAENAESDQRRITWRRDTTPGLPGSVTAGGQDGRHHSRHEGDTTMICTGCGCVFCPEPPDHFGEGFISPYCSKSCKSNSQRRRARAKGGRLSQYQQHKRARYRRAACAEQGKTTYPTEAAAREALTSLNAHGAAVLTDVYPCSGDHWHLTSRATAPVRIVRRGSDAPADLSDVKRSIGLRQPALPPRRGTA
jgi:hypothetical protein